MDDQGLIATFKLFAELIASNLDLQASLDTSNTALIDAGNAAKVQGEFVAVLGHDLRTPLSAIQMSADLLAVKLIDPQERRYVSTIQKSTGRIGEMIENVLDFARGRLGGGIPIHRCLTTELGESLQNVISEIRTTHPAAVIEQTLAVHQPVYCDVGRLCQLLSNLLANAVTHGSPAYPITVKAVLSEAELIIEVHNKGEPIAPALIPKLFQPFTRSMAGRRAEGLGLGLYIAGQIARAHGGVLAVESDTPTGTTFRAKFPIVEAG